jgi:hypothetical protein
MQNTSFTLETDGPVFEAIAFAPDGTCLFVKMKNGLEVFNSTTYSDIGTALAQEQVAEYFGIQTLGTIFVDNQPKKVTSRELFVLAFGQLVAMLFGRNDGIHTKSIIDSKF